MATRSPTGRPLGVTYLGELWGQRSWGGRDVQNSWRPGCPRPWTQGHARTHTVRAAHATYVKMQTRGLPSSHMPPHGTCTWTHTPRVLHSSHVSTHVHAHALSRPVCSDQQRSSRKPSVCSAFLDGARSCLHRATPPQSCRETRLHSPWVMTGVSLVSWPQVSGLGSCLGSPWTDSRVLPRAEPRTEATGGLSLEHIENSYKSLKTGRCWSVVSVDSEPTSDTRGFSPRRAVLCDPGGVCGGLATPDTIRHIPQAQGSVPQDVHFRPG